jgi:hypothetical protein
MGFTPESRQAAEASAELTFSTLRIFGDLSSPFHDIGSSSYEHSPSEANSCSTTHSPHFMELGSSLPCSQEPRSYPLKLIGFFCCCFQLTRPLTSPALYSLVTRTSLNNMRRNKRDHFPFQMTPEIPALFIPCRNVVICLR